MGQTQSSQQMGQVQSSIEEQVERDSSEDEQDSSDDGHDSSDDEKLVHHNLYNTIFCLLLFSKMTECCAKLNITEFCAKSILYQAFNGFHAVSKPPIAQMDESNNFALTVQSLDWLQKEGGVIKVDQPIQNRTELDLSKLGQQLNYKNGLKQTKARMFRLHILF